MTIAKRMVTLPTLALLALLSARAMAQASTNSGASVASDADTRPTPAATASFDLADVHASAKTTNPSFTSGSLRGDRYILHNATMVDMISLAYGVDSDNILSGPAWLDFNHYDVSAHAPRGTSPDDVKLMLQSLLTDRFHLIIHKDTHPQPAFLLTVGKGGAKLRKGEDDGASGCDETPNHPVTPPDAVPLIYVTCHNLTLDKIAESLRQMGGAYLTAAVVNSTGLPGTWSFDLKWTGRNNLARAGADGISMFDAVDKQLGLKLALEQYPTPVLVVNKVDETPTPNPPGLDKKLPPPPPAEFDVAVLTPSRPDAQLQGRLNGIQVNATGMSLKFLIDFAYNLNNNDDELIQNAPRFLATDKWDIVAKASPESQAVGPDGKPQIDFDLLPHMIETLLVERFKMKSHFEDRPIEAFTLVAAGPKMKKADPLNRTHCKEGPGPDGKDPRIANPILGRLLYCQNMTMAQLAELLPTLAGGYVFTPVLDATGLKDAYDFTLSFSTSGQLQSVPPPSNDPNAPRTTEPNGGLSLLDAMARQLGVKVVKEKRPSPVLVMDHIEEKPTDN
jgi:uncharacterized protein (TIGR03435 family)